MSKSKGYAALAPKAPLAPYSFERREPREHDVVIDIKYCGVCHSDIHQTRDEWSDYQDESIFPMVPGHEIAGVVSAVGSKVTKHKVGDKVGVGCFVDSCRTCTECQRGLEQYCSVQTIWTYNGRDKEGNPTYGGYSDRIVVDEQWEAGPGKKVAIVGMGGLGHMGVKLAHALGAEVTVLSQSLKKQADGKRLGADHFYATSGPETFTKLAGSFDLIINTVSAKMNWNEYLSLLKVDGTLVVVGLPEKDVPIAAFSLTAKRSRLAGSQIGGIAETQEMLDFCSKHGVACDIEVVPIQKINEAYERVLKSDVRYRFVIDMASLAKD